MTKAKNNKHTEKLLTETELELMTILWQLGEGSVTDVLENLPSGRNLAYTSVSTILRILEQKGILNTRKEGRGHVYIPSIAKSDYETKTVKHIVHRVFNNTPVALVRQLLNSVDLNSEELEELRLILKKAEKK